MRRRVPGLRGVAEREGPRGGHAVASTSRAVTRRAARLEGSSPFDLQARIHLLALERQDAEDAFVDSAEWFLPDEAVEAFDAEGELAQGERALCAEAARAQA